MRILDSVIFPGRSIYVHFLVAKITLDLEDLTDKESCEFPYFCTSVIALLPGLAEHKCSGREGGFPVHAGTVEINEQLVSLGRQAAQLGLDPRPLVESWLAKYFADSRHFSHARLRAQCSGHYGCGRFGARAL